MIVGGGVKHGFCRLWAWRWGRGAPDGTLCGGVLKIMPLTPLLLWQLTAVTAVSPSQDRAAKLVGGIINGV